MGRFTGAARCRFSFVHDPVCRGLGRGCSVHCACAGKKPPRLSPWLDYAEAALRVLRFADFRFAPPLRPLVLRAAPRADAALRVVFLFAPPFLFFDVIGMSNDSFDV